MSNQDIPFQLMAWIKRDQEERRMHAEKMAIKHYKEDDEFMRLISFLVRDWKVLKVREREFIAGLARQRDAGRIISHAQRGEVTRLWLKYSA